MPLHRDARVSRIALLHRLGRSVAAAAALDALLSRFAPPRGRPFGDLADAVCAASGHAGWVGVQGDGRIVAHADGLTLRLGRRWTGSPPRGADSCALPQDWRTAGVLVARASGGKLLGARIELARIGRVDGVVSLSPDGLLSGWAVAAADPEQQPVIEVFAADGGAPLASVVADDDSLMPEAGDGGTRPLGFRFRFDRETLGGEALHVRAQGGSALMGSPIRLIEEARACRAALEAGVDAWRPLPTALASVLPAAARWLPERRAIDVVIPLYRGAGAFAACLDSLGANMLPGLRIVAVDDGIAEPALRKSAEQAAARGRIVLLRHAQNRGFPAAVNTGLRYATDGPAGTGGDRAPGRDVVLLNSDTLAPPDAIARLAEAAYADARTGTATPLTTDGTLTTRQTFGAAEAMPDAAALATMDAAARAANAGLRVQLPTCMGFCVYIRHDCLAETGLLREDAFAQGYGEENDFSLRASQLGWDHVAACDVVVAHAGGTSFGAAGAALRPHNQAVLERLHPGYHAAVSTWIAADPLRPARFALDAKLWQAGQCPQAVVLVTHDAGGGVERRIAARVAALRGEGRRAIVVRPGDGFAVSDGTQATHPNLRFATVEALAVFLHDDHPVAVELHHTAAHDPAIARLAGLLRVPFDVCVHDFAAICPRVTLLGAPVGTGGPFGTTGYCGEPADRRVCEDCIADHGARIPFQGSVAAHRERHGMLLRAARRLTAPSRDAAERLRRFVPRLNPEVTPWEDDAVLTRAVRLPSLRPDSALPGARLQVALVGGIGEDKGYSVLLACARDAARRALQLGFVVIGHTIDDDRLLATDRVFITGRFEEGEAAALLQEFAPDLGFVPSVCPETWCYALSALWQAGLHVVAFDLGAQAERIAASGAGTLLPLGSTVARINQQFFDLAYATRAAAPALRRAAGGNRAFG